MNKLVASLAVATTLVVGAVSPLGGAWAVGIANGSFENSIFGPGPFTFVTLGAGSTSIDGWTVTSGTIDYIDHYWAAQNGNRSIDMNGNSIGSISQQLTGLSIGQTYRVSFWLAGNPDNKNDATDVIKKLGVTASAGSSTYTFDVTGSTRSLMNWALNYFDFTANATTADLTFTSLSGGTATTGPFYGAALDNITVAATPLPPALILFGSALAGLGLLGRRRRRSTTALGA